MIQNGEENWVHRTSFFLPGVMREEEEGVEGRALGVLWPSGRRRLGDASIWRAISAVLEAGFVDKKVEKSRYTIHRKVKRMEQGQGQGEGYLAS